MVLPEMRRLLAFVGVVPFVVGVLIVPTVYSLHLDHCDTSGQSGSHNPETCAICMAAPTALVLACVCVGIATVPQIARAFNLLDPFVSDTFISENHLARAPPVSA